MDCCIFSVPCLGRRVFPVPSRKSASPFCCCVMAAPLKAVPFWEIRARTRQFIFREGCQQHSKHHGAYVSRFPSSCCFSHRRQLPFAPALPCRRRASLFLTLAFQCIGEKNIKFFYLFLGCLCVHAFVVGALALMPSVKEVL